MWGKMALRCWIKSEEAKEGRVGVGVGWEKRTGEEDEQRILLETGGLAARLTPRLWLSSKMEDLFPHTMADMFRYHSAPLLSLLSLPPLLSHSPFLFNLNLIQFPSLYKRIWRKRQREMVNKLGQKSSNSINLLSWLNEQEKRNNLRRWVVRSGEGPIRWRHVGGEFVNWGI